MKYRIKTGKSIRCWLGKEGGMTISPKNAILFNSESEAKIQIERLKSLFSGLDNWEIEIVNREK